MKTKERGYLELQFEGGSKWMHFSMTSLRQLKKLSGKDIVEFGRSINENKSDDEKFDDLAHLIHAGLIAYDLEEGNDIDYNEYKVANWLWEAININNEIAGEIIECLIASTPKPGKKKETEKSPV